MPHKISFRNTVAYKKLKDHFSNISSAHMRKLFEQDAGRFKKFSIISNKILFDYSKNRIDDSTKKLLTELAEEIELKDAIESMFSGEKINETEHRAVLHIALRNLSGKPIYADGKDVMPSVNAVLEKMKVFSERVISGEWKGFTGKQITDVVNIGIGGSDLGPVMVTEALKYYKVSKINFHFVSNVDATHMIETIKYLQPDTTLFLIASKTFTTLETMTNAHTARTWFLQEAKNTEHIKKHFVALSTAQKEVVEFGIAQENMFEFWDWVGGRYSLWSAIGLSIMLQTGYEQFMQLLNGAYLIDKHFRTTEFENNIPVIMGLLSFWYTEFFGSQTHAVLPYDQYLHRLPAYLQQAVMESNGKHVDRNGNKINYETGPVIFGEPGTNGQHAFYQLIHQGTQIIPCDFIAHAISLHADGEHQQILLSNFFAQPEALMLGKNRDEVYKELKKKNMPEDEIKFQIPFRMFEGNKPTNSFLVEKLTPQTLGSLIALYEHKIFVQGIIWNIFSFDQFGVELGKKLAVNILPELKNENEIVSHNVSTNGLINYYKKMRNKL